MGRDKASSQEHPGAPDVIRFGSARPRHRRWPGWVALAVLLAAVVVVAVLHRKKPPPAPPAPSAVRVTEVGHRLLGAVSGWNLFGLGPDGVVRIQLERGRITRTAVPALQSSGPVSFVAGPDQAVIRPLDFVPGYLVADGRPAGRLPAALSHGGVIVPGPEPGQVWVLAGGSSRISLYALTTGRTGMSVSLPSGSWVVGPDGRGGVLLQDSGGSFYDAGPGGTRLITTGTVVAVGPTRWLAVRCGSRGHCAEVVINPASGTRRVVPGIVARTAGSVGVISPDGSIAAVFRPEAGGRAVLQLINLRSGATQSLPVAVRGPLGPQDLAWSPDSRWLFTVTANGQLRAVDARTGLLRSLGVALPPITELAVRNAPPRGK